MRHRNGINDTLPIGTKELNPGATNFDASSDTQQMRRYETAAADNDTKETMLVQDDKQSEVGQFIKTENYTFCYVVFIRSSRSLFWDSIIIR